LGAAFLRAVRFSFFRSSLSSILVVSATYNLFRCNLFRVSRTLVRSSARSSTGSEVYVSRELTRDQFGGAGRERFGTALFGAAIIVFQGTMESRPEIDPPCSAPASVSLLTSSALHAPITALTGVRYAF
jgi:hypothetical protein